MDLGRTRYIMMTQKKCLDKAKLKHRMYAKHFFVEFVATHERN